MSERVWGIDLAEDGKSIWLKLDGYDPAVVENIKSDMIPTPRYWLKAHGVWKLPLMQETCHGVRKIATIAGAKLKIGEALRVWFVTEQLRIDSIPDPNQKELTPEQEAELSGVLEREHPVMWEALCKRPFQKVGIRYIAQARAALLGDQPGAGKTLQTIAGIVEAGVTGPIIVVAAPKSAAEITWPKELKRWVPGDTVVSIGGDQKPQLRKDSIEFIRREIEAGKYADKRIWLVTSPGYVRMNAEVDKYGNYVKVNGKKVLKPGAYAMPELFDFSWGAIVADESHKTLAVATQNRKKWSAQRIGMELLPLRPNGIRVAISGTPWRGKLENAYGTSQFLHPDKYRSFWRWAEQYFVIFADPSGFGGQEVGEIRDEAAYYADLKAFMIRRTKAEIAPDLPPKLYGGTPIDGTDKDGKPLGPVAVWLPMKGDQLKQYRAMKKSATVELEGGELTANGVLAELTRLKQFACSAGRIIERTFYPTLPSNKFDWIVDHLTERGIAGEDFAPTTKIIIASQFTKLINVFEEELNKIGVQTFKLTGETSARRRLKLADIWQTVPVGGDTPHVLLLNMIAGGASITLDEYADEMITVDEMWNRDDQEQAEDRIHRLSNMHQVTIYNLRSEGSVEEKIARVAHEKDTDIKAVLDGARGVDFALNLLSDVV